MVFDPTTFVREVAEVGVREAAQTLRDEPDKGGSEEAERIRAEVRQGSAI
jgi:hypothetical protein